MDLKRQAPGPLAEMKRVPPNKTPTTSWTQHHQFSLPLHLPCFSTDSNRRTNAQSGTIGTACSWAAVVSRVVDAYLAVLARNASKAAAENGRDADAGHVAGQAAAADVRVVHADLAFGAVDGLDAKAAAGLVGRPLADGGQSGGGSQEGQDGEGEITHGESRVGRVRDDPGEIL